MKEFKTTRRIAPIFLLLFFTLGVGSLYLSHSPNLNLEVTENRLFAESTSDQYRSFSYNVTNTGNKPVKPEFWIVNHYEKSPRNTFSKNVSIDPGETARFNISIAEDEPRLQFNSEYQLIIKDKLSGDRFSKIFSFDMRKPGKNPYFIQTDYYPYHWSGSSFGTGNYHINHSGLGINASFSNCEASFGCGFSYRNSYDFKPLIRVRGESFNLTNATLMAKIEGNEHIEVPINIQRDGKFRETINITEKYGKSNNEEIVYEIKFMTYQDNFHWIDIQEFNFYHPNK